MQFIDNIFFVICILVGFGLFAKSLRAIYKNIMLGHTIDRTDRPADRWKMMFRVAFGQSKMGAKPIAGLLHFFVYIGFIIINLEMMEILIDGIFGTHRYLEGIFGKRWYSVFTAILEILAFLVLISVVIFFVRRNFIKVKRFNTKDLKGWAKDDANWILLIEASLMIAFLVMNSADFLLNEKGVEDYYFLGKFPISLHTFVPIFANLELSSEALFFIERFSWWYHILGILFFMNYLYYSKHLHILLAFPNTWFANLDKKGKMNNLESVTKEVRLMMDPNADPYAVTPEAEVPAKFGAEDIFDLNRVQLLNAYTCTECGRCTAACPANITGKKLSPRKIMMDTRDRLEEVGRNIRLGKAKEEGKKLLDGYISREEIWACTSCNACVEACPVLIDPLSIILEMRRFLVMEQSAAPTELNMMMNNIENNAAPWQYNQSDRLNWAKEN